MLVDAELSPMLTPIVGVHRWVQAADEAVECLASLRVCAIGEDVRNLVHTTHHQENLDLVCGSRFRGPASKQALEACRVRRRPQFSFKGLQQEAVTVVEIEEEDGIVSFHDLRLVLPQGRPVADLEWL